jgi:hypothetical protein
MIIDLQARHIFKAHKQEFEIGYVFFRVLDENERVVRVTTPCKWPAAPAADRIPDKASTMKLNRRGDSGSP